MRNVTQRFGRFEIVSPLGQGGFAQTHVALERSANGHARRVCLKRVLPQPEDEPDWIELFHNEARIASLLDHPNIVAVHELGETAGAWWMSMELVEGVDLRTLLAALGRNGERLAPGLVALVALEVSQALAYAHARTYPDGTPAGIIHRDVTPSNILIGYDGAVKLTDFGVAKALQSDRTRSGRLKGKVPYMSHEQAVGLELDGRADVYSLGVTMFEMLAGVRPYDGKTDLETFQNAIAARRPELRELAGHAPAELVALVETMIASDREQRPSDAGELRDALLALAGGEPADLGWLARAAGAAS